ncbi:MAG: YnhF family membrane protein [Enterobacteriaceae bacterium]
MSTDLRWALTTTVGALALIVVMASICVLN